MPRKLVITEGNCFLGQALLKIFTNGWDVYALTKSESQEANDEKFITCDLGDKEAVHSLLQRLKPDVVIHWYV
jgi:dTDP-4-dehydrorhamnose reductase